MHPARQRNSAFIVLSIFCAILLATAVGFGAAALWLSNVAPTSAGTPSPDPTPTVGGGAESKPQTVQGFDITTVSDLTFGAFALSATDEDGFTVIYAKIENDDPANAAEVYFDITAYGPDGRVVGRTPSNMYLLPGQRSLFYGIMASDMTKVDRIKIEQTNFDLAPPVVSGDLSVDTILGGEEGLVEATFTSAFSAPSEYAEVYIAGFVDEQLFAVCQDKADIPAGGGTFTVRCRLDAVSTDRSPQAIDEIPEDAVFDAYWALDIPQ